MRVMFIPGEKDFEAHAHESLLDAALRAGLSPDYGCSNGSCGRCLARLCDGQVQRLRPHDYRLSAQQQRDNILLLCSCAATTDLRLEVATAQQAGDIPLQRLSARVRRIDPAGDDNLILHLRTPRSQTLRFIAGQHVRLALANGLQRELPLASCPCDGMNLEFHLQRDSADCFTDFMFEGLQTSMTIEVEGPFGDFTLDDEAVAPLLVIAWETGFGPLRSLIEHCLSLEWPAPIHLYWIVHNDKGIYADGYCRSIADAMDNVHYTPLVVGEIDAAITHIAAEHPQLHDHLLYIAAPPAVAERITARLPPAWRCKIDPLVA